MLQIVRTSFCLWGAALLLASSARLHAVDDPGAMQDAQEERLKLLKAADQIQMIQNNSEAAQKSVDGMKTDLANLHDSVTKLQADNADLQKQIAALKDALEKSEAARAKEKQVLLDSIAEMMANNKAAATPPKTSKKKESATASTGDKPDKTADSTSDKTQDKTAPKADKDAAKDSSTTAANTDNDGKAAAAKPQKGYYHIVASGETLTLICNAFREQGVNVTVAEVQKANGLTDKSILKVGQKLFIPKPGT
jgi:hypothetical protein